MDAGSRTDELSALDLWDIVRSTNNTVKPNHSGIQERVQDRTPKLKHQLTKESERVMNCQMWTTYPQTHIHLKVRLSCTFFDYQRQQSNNETRVKNTQSCNWLFDSINLDSRIQIKYVITKNQPADINRRKLHT